MLTPTPFTRLRWLTKRSKGANIPDLAHLDAHLNACRNIPLCHICGNDVAGTLRLWLNGLRVCRDDEACLDRYAALPSACDQGNRRSAA
jgi:hypothetical protein